MGGVQIKDNSSDTRVKPFAHALVGFARGKNTIDTAICSQFSASGNCSTFFNNSSYGLAGAIGGGLDIKVTPRVDVRAIQVDYNPTGLFGTHQNNVRFGVGLVFH